MKIIGLTGGIASGKSTVAAKLAALGAVVLDADQAAHQAINLPEVKQALVDRWGATILAESGEIDRSAIAERVFSTSPESAAERRFLEETLHPRIRDQFERKMVDLAASGTATAVIDAPLLLEAGWQNLCDTIIFVESSPANRLERASLRNWTAEEFSRREAAQMSIEQKRQQATHLVANDGSPDDLAHRVEAIWAEICQNDD